MPLSSTIHARQASDPKSNHLIDLYHIALSILQRSDGIVKHHARTVTLTISTRRHAQDHARHEVAHSECDRMVELQIVPCSSTVIFESTKTTLSKTSSSIFPLPYIGRATCPAAKRLA